MKFIKSNQRILTACLIGVFVIGFTLTSLDQIFEPMWTSKEAMFCFVIDDPSVTQKPSQHIGIFSQQTDSNPFAILFQIMFILFFISPPIIALMLFCIWKELKKRNDLK